MKVTPKSMLIIQNLFEQLNTFFAFRFCTNVHVIQSSRTTRYIELFNEVSDMNVTVGSCFLLLFCFVF